MHHLTVASVSGYVRDVLRTDRDRAHTHVMSAFPIVPGGEAPRSKMGVLWYLDERASTLTVQSAIPPSSPGLLGDIIQQSTFETPPVGQQIHIRVFRNCQKTPMSRTPVELRPILKQGRAYRSRFVVVPEEERRSWAVKSLRAIGLEPEIDTVTSGVLTDALLGRRHPRVPSVEIEARCSVADRELFETGIRRGIGRRLSYGLGLPRIAYS